MTPLEGMGIFRCRLNGVVFSYCMIGCVKLVVDVMKPMGLTIADYWICTSNGCGSRVGCPCGRARADVSPSCEAEAGR